jgi:DNA-binding beta-propeller fold protein YncE
MHMSKAVRVLKKVAVKVGRVLLSASLVATSLLGPLSAPKPADAAIANGMAAIDVLGQYDTRNESRLVPSFTNAFGFAGGPTPYGFYGYGIMMLDLPNRRLFVSDAFYHRVLVYEVNSNGTLVDNRPDHVLGQADMFSGLANRGLTAPTAATLNTPRSFAWDAAAKRLFVSDGGNHRILIYDLSSGITDGMNASVVLGQDVMTCGLNNHNSGCTVALSTPTASTMYYPTGLYWDSVRSRLLVADGSNNRVLVFTTLADGQAATAVIGQPGMTTNTLNNGGRSASTLYGPFDVEWDEANSRLFVSDSTNRRVLTYDLPGGTIAATGETADHVLGQDNMTCGFYNHDAACTVSTSTPTASTMYAPRMMAWDAANSRLFVADGSNSRVLAFESLGTSFANGRAADHVLGQDSMNCWYANHDAACTTYLSAPTASTLNGPYGVEWDAVNNRLWTSEYAGSRILSFDNLAPGFSDGHAADRVLGQYTRTSVNGMIDLLSPTMTQGGMTSGGQMIGLFSNSGTISFDTLRHHMFVADRLASRVLVYNLNADNTLSDRIPDHVIGQQNLFMNPSFLSRTTLNYPGDTAIDVAGGRLFVVDRTNHRVMVYDVSGSFSNGPNATYVLGQADFTSGTAATAQNRMNAPYGVGYDATNQRLYVGEVSANRVTVYDVRPEGSPALTLCGTTTTGIATGMNASCVLGQSAFNTAATSTAATGIYGAQGIVWDETSKSLFVGDSGNNRVLVFSLPIPTSISNGMAATAELGQTNFGVNAADVTSQTSLSNPSYLALDEAGRRLFVTDTKNNRVMVWSISGAVTNGMAASYVVGQADFLSKVTGTTQKTLNFANNNPGVGYEPTSKRLYVNDFGNNRVMVFDASTATGTVTSTLDGSLTLSRLAAGQSATGSLSYTLTHNVSTQLTVTFPAGFTVTGDATGAASSSCLSNFAHTATQITADKSNCAGPVTLGGFTVSLPGAPGAYTVSWVNDDPGSATVYVVNGDTISVNATVDPSIAFDVGAASACDGSFSSSDWSVDLGRMSTGRTVASSGDASGAQLICTKLSTNATFGAVVTVHNANGTSGLVSASTPADRIPSAAAAVTSGTPNYGLCFSTVPGDYGYDSGLTPAANAPSTLAGSFSPAGTCTSSVASGAEPVAALSASPIEAWRVAGVTSNAFAAMRVKAAISATQPAHSDYSDSLTFVATATF